ncbi:hypothetical protein [Aquamicrobium sp.]|uniref:hypothetical protein n=1 Tax=Aquamicrobium sp. TaxID=1872579 RepID=UPI0025904129|nr:hypothetical protein [Aquamicrobium sp.]MCK9549456.1 hypothetical protein [Aquamicrobium sp.]
MSKDRIVLIASWVFFPSVFVLAAINGVNPLSGGASQFEKGRYFEGVKEVNNTVPKAKTGRRTEDILEEMLVVQKQQLDRQDKILAILENEFEPKPKEIVVNGKKCIENSSAECFNMPLLSKEAKTVPVIAAYLKNPNVETAKSYLQWHAKYLKSAFAGGTSIELAIAKYGQEAYPLNYNTVSSDTAGGYSTVLNEKNNKMVLDSMRDSFEMNIYLGKSADMDVYAIDNIAEFLRENKGVKANFIFYSGGSKKIMDAIGKRMKDVAIALNSANSVVVDSKRFSSHNIFTTPTIEIYIKSKGKNIPLFNGRLSSNSIATKIVDVLEVEDVIKQGHSPMHKQWERAGEYSHKYLKDQYSIDINKQYLKQQYK